jgi:hypothetical protein
MLQEKTILHPPPRKPYISISWSRSGGGKDPYKYVFLGALYFLLVILP